MTTVLVSFYTKKGEFPGPTQALEDSQAKLKKISGPGTIATVPGRGSVEIQDPEIGWATISLNTCSNNPLGWTTRSPTMSVKEL